MGRCSHLEALPTDVNLESLEQLNLQECFRLRNFPQISRNISKLYLGRSTIEEETSFWVENMSRLTDLVWDSCPLRCMPAYFRPEYLSMRNSKLEYCLFFCKLIVNRGFLFIGASIFSCFFSFYFSLLEISRSYHCQDLKTCLNFRIFQRLPISRNCILMIVIVW